MKQSQKNIQTVKVIVGDLRRKRKAKKKGKGKSKSSKIEQQPFAGQAQTFIPSMFPASRAGSQFEPPRQQVVEPQKIADVIIAKLQEEQQRQQSEKLAERARVLSKGPQDWSASSSSSSGVRLEEPPKPIDRPQQPLVSNQVNLERARLRLESVDELNKLRKRLNIGELPAGATKEQLIEVIVGYKR